MNYFKKQNGKCNICYIDICVKKHIDHKVPLCKSGVHSIDNIQLLCPECNRRKGTKDNEEFLLIKKQVL
ncbi:HNHc domain containing protein [uncultured Caudovirales phage]|uniref:HNHc domain containing protein n=1 Tax=uncultured Caudovirales phage TaxID=2100421 RepID=A0A6J5L8B1_9CAUD|nr:HNHc domain containing protein [uncultured Caudovirales phage]